MVTAYGAAVAGHRGVFVVAWTRILSYIDRMWLKNSVNVIPECRTFMSWPVTSCVVKVWPHLAARACCGRLALPSLWLIQYTRTR